jgi:predicted small lipoprotein YifL
MLSRRLVRSLAALSALVLVSGCGNGGPALVPVEGVVTLDGAPLSDAAVSLTPLKATDPGPYMATTDAAGHYTIGTSEDPGGGAAPGEYFLNMSTLKTEAQTDAANMDMAAKVIRPETVPLAYRNSSTTFTVPPEGSTTANFDLKSK